MRRVVGIPITPSRKTTLTVSLPQIILYIHDYPSNFGGPKDKCEKNIEINPTNMLRAWPCIYVRIKSPSYFTFHLCERHIQACTVLVITKETLIPTRQVALSFLY
jgi:hypothetical protein